MNLLSMVTAVEQWLADERTDVAVNSAGCLHSRHKAATCDRCVHACPVAALSIDNTIMLNAETCVQCGLCLHICPVGAFYGDDGVGDLLNVVARLPKQHIVELACAVHPQPEKGPSQSSAVLQTKGCLAALGPAAVLSLFALGVEHLLVRLDACHACPLGKVRAEIADSVLRADQLVTSKAGADQRVSLLDAVHEDWPIRRVTTTTQPARSRREFFKLLTAVDEPSPLVRHLTADEAQAEGKPLPRDRQRLLAAWQLLPADEMPSPSPTALEALSFAQITANESCTACGVCAQVCPTDALQLVIDDDEDCYNLTFTARNCVDCGLCLTLCEPDALRRQPPSAETVLADQPEIIQQGQLQYCRRCKAGFANGTDSDLCPVCTFRQQHPFGSRLISS